MERKCEFFRNYISKLHNYAVKWEKPQQGMIKCNTNVACRGNPRESVYSFSLRNDKGDVIYA